MNRIISFFKGKGFYLALALCILAAAASSLVQRSFALARPAASGPSAT